MQETEAFIQARGSASIRQSFGAALGSHVKQVLVCMGIVTSGTISFYVILPYMPTFARVQLHLPLDQAFLAQAISLASMIVITPLSGALSDFIGRKPIMFAALCLYFVFVYSLFSWLHDAPSFGRLVEVQIAFCCLLGVFFGPISTAVAEQFLARTRATGLGIAYNMAVMIFGGFAQFFVTWLIEATGSPIAPSFYVMFGAAVGIAATFFLVDRAWDARLEILERTSAASSPHHP